MISFFEQRISCLAPNYKTRPNLRRFYNHTALVNLLNLAGCRPNG